MRTLLILLMCLPGYSFAASGGDKGVPKPTQTTKSCWGVRVWDEKEKRCVRPKESSLDTDGLYGAVLLVWSAVIIIGICGRRYYTVV